MGASGLWAESPHRQWGGRLSAAALFPKPQSNRWKKDRRHVSVFVSRPLAQRRLSFQRSPIGIAQSEVSRAATTSIGWPAASGHPVRKNYYARQLVAA